MDEARKEEQDHATTLHQVNVENPALVTLKTLPPATHLNAHVRITVYCAICTKYYTIMSTLAYRYIRVFLNIATKFLLRFNLLAETLVGDHVWLTSPLNIDSRSSEVSRPGKVKGKLCIQCTSLSGPSGRSLSRFL